MLYRKLILNYRHRGHLWRLLSTSQNGGVSENEEIVQTDIQKKKPVHVTKELRSYLKNNDAENLINIIPESFLRKNSLVKASRICVINSECAKELVSLISEDLLQNTCHVIECNPGLGLVTKELLNIGVPRIHLFERSEEFIRHNSPLHFLIQKHQDRLHLNQLNFFSIWKVAYDNQFQEQNFVDVYLKNAPYHSWKKETFAQIIVLCPNKSFLSKMMHSFFNQTKIFDHGRPVFFMVLPSDTWTRSITISVSEGSLELSELRYYSPYSVMIHLFFEFKCLGQVSRENFVPWPSKKGKQNPIKVPMSVVKLEPKSNTFYYIKKDDLRAFWFFLKYCMRSRKLRVIEEFEKIVPGCGPKLIELDFDICSKFKDIPPKKFLELFKAFKSWPEYDENLFIPPDHIKKEEEKLEVEDELLNEGQSKESTQL